MFKICKNTGVGSHSLPQRTFLTQGSNPGLLHCRQILYHLTRTQKLRVWSSILKAASFARTSESRLWRFQLQPITASALGFLLILTSSWICIGYLHLRLPMVLWETQLIADDGKKYIISFQLAGEDGERRRVSGREGTRRKWPCLVHLKRGRKAAAARGLGIWWANE